MNGSSHHFDNLPEGYQIMELSFSRSNEPIDRLINLLVEEAGGIHHPAVIKEMILATLKIGQDVDV